tara:strand:+ start:262 stop:486 length:225 start_codon:yes stop_codon:yes gene_type:complete
MATVTNWIDHLSAKEVAGAVYPGAGSSETLLVIIGVIIWIGWHVITNASESKELSDLARKRRGGNDYKSNITNW